MNAASEQNRITTFTRSCGKKTKPSAILSMLVRMLAKNLVSLWGIKLCTQNATNSSDGLQKNISYSMSNYQSIVVIRFIMRHTKAKQSAISNTIGKFGEMQKPLFSGYLLPDGRNAPNPLPFLINGPIPYLIESMQWLCLSTISGKTSPVFLSTLYEYLLASSAVLSHLV